MNVNPDVEGRSDNAIRAAVAMAQAGNQRDILGVYDVWNTLTASEKADVITALAQLPAFIIDEMGGNATQLLADAAKQLTRN